MRNDKKTYSHGMNVQQLQEVTAISNLCLIHVKGLSLIKIPLTEWEIFGPFRAQD